MTAPDLIALEVSMIHHGMGIAILSDGQEVPITDWLGTYGPCDPVEATACVCGPCFDGRWYVVNLSDFVGSNVQ